MDIKSFQTNLDLNNLNFDKYADIIKQNAQISKTRTQLYGDRNFNTISQNKNENYIAIKNNKPITYTRYKDYTIYSNNMDLLYYEGTNSNYIINKNTDTNLISKLSLVDKMFLLTKNDALDNAPIIKDEAYFMRKMLNDMIAEQTYFMLGKSLVSNGHLTGAEYNMNFARNYSYANKFTPNAGYANSDNYTNSMPLIPNSYYLNSYANSNLINTKFGKAEIFLDLAGNNDELGIGTLNKNAQLFRFDSDGNGFVDKNDMYFDKLKIRAYDKNGNEIIKKLSDVVDRIDLKDFIDSKENAIKKWDKQVSNYGWDEKTYNASYEYISSYNPYSHFKAEVRYQSMNENDLKELAKLADNDGWIDASKLKNLANLAYAKINFDGNYKLEELNYAKDQTSKNSDQYLKFKALYDDYMAELNALNGFFDSYKQVASDEIMAEFGDIINNPEFKSSKMLKIQSEFVAITGLKFSLENLQKVKDSFETDKKAAANMLIDTDSLTAIRINENGTFTLRFNSGREINVSKLYKDSGKAFNEALNVNADFMDEKELNEKIDLSVSVVKIKNETTGKLEEKSLKDLGVELIQKTTNGKLFILRTKEGKSIVVNQIYTKTQNEAQNSQNAQSVIDEKEKFYPKPLKIWA
ncbi:hypothetical protein CINF_1553 [Candidatus Campylobacter infans]|uniref:Uncharacterized protein n=1 Tax=Candidatus Campylobacter infans TaxID=2561898 RepID=A0A7H9CIV0_9BACT|nr:hypothetical protein [Candidatus Campylobacter infans]QLI06030.1 hypothetical protein CINF_1553 [Candidatus Campylobacter infans]